MSYDARCDAYMFFLHVGCRITKHGGMWTYKEGNGMLNLMDDEENAFYERYHVEDV
jgi:hypothetical protein